MIEEIVREPVPRLDRRVAGLLGVSRERAKALIRAGAVTVNGGPAAPDRALVPGDRLAVADAPPAKREMPEPAAGPLDILLDDPALVVLNKPPGILTHPLPGRPGGSLVNRLLAIGPLSPIGLPLRPGVVHRLDRGTSGAIVFARTESAHRSLSNQFRNRTVEKVYWALLDGAPPRDEDEVEFTVHPSRGNPAKMSVRFFRGRAAVTRIRVIAKAGGVTLAEARPLTGRTHQIRIAFSHLGCPVLGDALYGRPSQAVGRAALHARILGFDHPLTGERLRFTAPVPPDFAAAAGRLLDPDAAP